MRRLVLILLAFVAIGAVAVTVLDLQKPPPPERGGETKDRLPIDKMRRMVEEPAELVEKGDLAGAKKLFEQQLAATRKREGANSLEAADLLTAFASVLWEDHQTDAVPYFARGVTAYRAAVGPDDPELAVALHSHADALTETNDAPPALAQALLEEALRIRLRALGTRNAETAVTYKALGVVKGHPVHTGRDPAKIAAAANDIRRAIALLPNAPNADPSDLDDARFRLAEVYARNGLGGEAAEAVQAYAKTDDYLLKGRVSEIADHLEKAGDGVTAAMLRETYEIEAEPQEATPADPPSVKQAGKLRP